MIIVEISWRPQSMMNDQIGEITTDFILIYCAALEIYGLNLFHVCFGK